MPEQALSFVRDGHGRLREDLLIAVTRLIASPNASARLTAVDVLEVIEAMT